MDVEALFGSAFCGVFGDVQLMSEDEPVMLGVFAWVVEQVEGASSFDAA